MDFSNYLNLILSPLETLSKYRAFAYFNTLLIFNDMFYVVAVTSVIPTLRWLCSMGRKAYSSQTM